MYMTEEKSTQDLEGKLRQIPLGGPRHRWKDIKMDLKKTGLDWTGLLLLRTGPSSRPLRTQRWTFRFYKMQGIFRLAEKLLTSQE